MTAPILVLGNVNVDLVMGPVDGWPAIGTEVEVERAEMRAGARPGTQRWHLPACESRTSSLPRPETIRTVSGFAVSSLPPAATGSTIPA